MDDDFNTPVAIAAIMTMVRTLNRNIFEENNDVSKKFKDKFFGFVKKIEQIFGIFPDLKHQLEKKYADKKDKLINSLLELIMEMRSKLRAKKMYGLSDEIRNKLRELGLKIEDD